MKHIFSATMAVSALASVSSDAALVAISNSDFEANGPGFVQATGWTPGTNTARVADHASFRNQSGLVTGGATVGGGLHFAFTQGTTGPAEQTLGTTFTVNSTYVLSANVNYGTSDVGVNGIFSIGYDAGAGFVELGSSTIDLAPLNLDFAGAGSTGSGTGWARAAGDAVDVLAGSAAIGENIIIRINSSATQGLWFDNVELDAVPEPSTALLGGLGLLGLLRRRC